MAIGPTQPAGGAKPVRGKPATGSGDSRLPRSARSVADVTTVMGIPEAEFTSKVRAAILGLMEEVDRLRQELQQTRARLEKIEEIADQDALVPVANRRAFVREMARIMAFAARYDSPGSILYFDLNGLKTINDNFGHAAGDAALRNVARILAENVRESDVVGRLGGDEFGVILARSDRAEAEEKAMHLAQAIATNPALWEGKELPLTVAYGAYCFEPGEDIDTALANADKAMYENKKQTKRANGERPPTR